MSVYDGLDLALNLGMFALTLVGVILAILTLYLTKKK